MSRFAILAVLAFTFSACSSAEESAPASDDAALAGDAASDVASESAVDATGDGAIDAADAPPDDTGPCGKREEPCCGGVTCEGGLVCETLPKIGPTCLCDTSLCDRFGYVCDGNVEVACGPTAPGSCYVPIKSRECPADQPCDAATGTCGGCDRSDLCSAKTDGAFLGCAPYVAQWCRNVDGCVVTVKESCGIACVGGARQGCCGGDGQMCCSPPSAACVDGLTCKSDVCSK